MAAVIVTITDVRKLQREIQQLRKRIERLEKKPNAKAGGKKKNGANGHGTRVSSSYKTRKPRARTLREAPANEPLLKFIGADDLVTAGGLDNEQIDRDLANEYGSPHEPK